MKATLPYPKSNVTSRPKHPSLQTGGDEDDGATPLAFYFFAGLLVLALLYFVVLTFIL